MIVIFFQLRNVPSLLLEFWLTHTLYNCPKTFDLLGAIRRIIIPVCRAALEEFVYKILYFRIIIPG